MIPSDRLYDPLFVRSLFDEMAATYGLVNLITSFGFSARWRKQCVRFLNLPASGTVIDLMTGMGELVPDLVRRRVGSIHAIDLSPEMCRRAKEKTARFGMDISILEADALASGKPSESADAVVSSFGLKTFSHDQLRQLAAEIARMLKPGAPFSLIEIAVPGSRVLRWPYMFYIHRVIPLLGRLLLGNPDNYRLLGEYTGRFGSGDHVLTILESAGLEVKQVGLFFGCATALVGRRPVSHNSPAP